MLLKWPHILLYPGGNCALIQSESRLFAECNFSLHVVVTKCILCIMLHALPCLYWISSSLSTTADAFYRLVWCSNGRNWVSNMPNRKHTTSVPLENPLSIFFFSKKPHQCSHLSLVLLDLSFLISFWGWPRLRFFSCLWSVILESFASRHWGNKPTIWTWHYSWQESQHFVE